MLELVNISVYHHLPENKLTQAECCNWLKLLWLNQCVYLISKGGNYLKLNIKQI